MGSAMQRLGDRVAARRMKLGYETQGALSVATGVARSTIGLIERGERLPRTNTRVRLEQALRWSPGDMRTVLEGGEPTPTVVVGDDSRDTRAELDEALERLQAAAEHYARLRRELNEGENHRRGA